MLLRRLTHVVMVSALAAGCSQSLFDDGTSGGGDGPDAGPRPDAREGFRPDANPTDPDAGMITPDDGGVPPDDGGVIPDASDGCTGACINDDAFANFDGLQGGNNARWRYVEFRPETDSYDDMAPGDVNGFLGFVGTGTPAPSLAYCATMDEPPCTAVLQTGSLVMTTTAPGAHHPALMWIVPYDGTYSVTVSYRTALGAPDIPATVMLVHNDQSNILASAALDELATLYGEPSTVAGDVIVLSLITESETSVFVGVNMVITGPD
jgi:hypothetical protein